MAGMSDIRRAIAHRNRRRTLYMSYKSQVLEDRERMCRWIVQRIVSRYKADLQRTGARVGLMAWLNQNDSLQTTYSDAYALETRREWANWQVSMLLDESMQLLEDGSNGYRAVEELLENLLNAEHGETEWIIRVRIKTINPFMWKGKERRAYRTLRFSHDRRPHEST